MVQSTIISPETIPDGDEITFTDSTYFINFGRDASLPSPESVMRRALKTNPKHDPSAHIQVPVRFPRCGLLVKYGYEPRVSIAEGRTLRALREAAIKVPVPEIYGWKKEGRRVFLYMEDVGCTTTLEYQWDILKLRDRAGICKQLKAILGDLRRLKQPPGQASIGNICGGPLNCVVLTSGRLPAAGPFSAANPLEQFYNWISKMTEYGIGNLLPSIDKNEIPDFFRDHLPSQAEIVFTHADLHPSNILISISSPTRVVAIVDWGQAGWYPDFWEYCKAMYTSDYESEWATKYIPLFLDKPAEGVEAFEYYAEIFGH
ncbi:hypothetical protein ANO11243_054120 [Dothideomycetidae sp. 11243]|nr:hypothetical protein ANO11243_054120 [fungal sp. No.11243]